MFSAKDEQGDTQLCFFISHIINKCLFQGTFSAKFSAFLCFSLLVVTLLFEVASEHSAKCWLCFRHKKALM